MRKAAPVLLVLCITACSEKSGKAPVGEAGGTVVISTTGDPGALFPPLIRTTQGKQISEQIYDYLADVGPEMNTRGEKGFRPQLTDGWRWSADSLSLAFHINPRARWHDGKTVTAHDVQFTFALNRNPALGGAFLSELANIDSVTASDSLTAVFWFTSGSQHNSWTLPPSCSYFPRTNWKGSMWRNFGTLRLRQLALGAFGFDGGTRDLWLRLSRTPRTTAVAPNSIA